MIQSKLVFTCFELLSVLELKYKITGFLWFRQTSIFDSEALIALTIVNTVNKAD